MSAFYKYFIEPMKCLRAMRHPPVGGYSVFTFSHNQEVQEYLTENTRKIAIVVVASLKSEIFEKFQQEVANAALGNPSDVSLGYIDIDQCTNAFIDAHRVITLPTCLLFHDRKLVYKVCGLRVKELSLKARLALRAVDLNPCSS